MSDAPDPTYTVQQFAQVLAAENEWDADKALTMAHQIRQARSWEAEETHTEASWIWAALSWWGSHPVPEDEEGPVYT